MDSVKLNESPQARSRLWLSVVCVRFLRTQQRVFYVIAFFLFGTWLVLGMASVLFVGWVLFVGLVCGFFELIFLIGPWFFWGFGRGWLVLFLFDGL